MEILSFVKKIKGEMEKYDIIVMCSDGGTGIRVRLKIEWRNPCGFDSRSEHHRCYVFFGAWRSPVARTHGVREVRSSNLLAPTKQGAE